MGAPKSPQKGQLASWPTRSAQLWLTCPWKVPPTGGYISPPPPLVLLHCFMLLSCSPVPSSNLRSAASLYLISLVPSSPTGLAPQFTLCLHIDLAFCCSCYFPAPDISLFSRILIFSCLHFLGRLVDPLQRFLACCLQHTVLSSQPPSSSCFAL